MTLKPIQISLEGVGWNSLNISWPKTNVLNNRPFEVEVNGRSFNVTGASTPLLALMEQTNYSVRVREIFNGLSPWSEIAQFSTRSLGNNFCILVFPFHMEIFFWLLWR